MFQWRSALTRCLGMISVLYAQSANAGDTDLLLARTLVSDADPQAQALREHARALDQILTEGAPDLGLQPTLLPESRTRDEDELPSAASDAWVVVPHLATDGGRLKLRIVAVAPGSEVLMVRLQTLTPKQLELRSLLMFQELVEAGRPGQAHPSDRPEAPLPQASDTAPPSEGRAVLALNAAVYGGYVGFTVHRASGSSDVRLLYPLTALGAGLGLGAAMLVADEWDITEGSAWYLSAGQVWPALAGVALGAAYDDRSDYHHLYGLLGATTGLVLATSMVSSVPISPGHAALAHSGGAFGTLLGGLTEAMVRPNLDEAPLRGIGYGAAAGVLALGSLAPMVDISASRVLFIDLSAGLGALTGAAVASPLVLVGDDVSQQRSRVWFGSVMGGTLLGAALGTWITRGEHSEEGEEPPPVARPAIGVVGFEQTRSGSPQPVFGAALDGVW